MNGDAVERDIMLFVRLHAFMKCLWYHILGIQDEGLSPRLDLVNYHLSINYNVGGTNTNVDLSKTSSTQFDTEKRACHKNNPAN
jgi:hypothetical protein